MFQGITKVADAIHALQATVKAGFATLSTAAQLRTEDDGLEGRVRSLEGDLARHMAEAEGLLLKAEGTFKAARAAEERARGKEQRAEKLLASAGDEDGEGALPEWYLDQLRGGDGGGSTEEPVQPVRNGVETREETVARLRRQKFGF